MLSHFRSRWRWLGVAAFGAAALTAGAMFANRDAAAPLAAQPPCGKQEAWTAPQVRQGRNRFLYTPKSDGAAAACVSPRREAVPSNVEPNNYVPSDAELRAYRSARDSDGKTPRQYMYYARFVTGRPGIREPSTDELIQWGSHKWGIPTDWLRAQYTQESQWRQDRLGDLRVESRAWYPRFPRFSCPRPRRCYESLGITQVKWQPWDDVGTEPLRWKSTAFNIDYQGAKLRFYYDNPYGKRAAWDDPSYRPLQEWRSICGWFQPYPWGNREQRSYCLEVKKHLAARDWPRPRRRPR